jgi:hypothetical protein
LRFLSPVRVQLAKTSLILTGVGFVGMPAKSGMAIWCVTSNRRTRQKRKDLPTKINNGIREGNFPDFKTMVYVDRIEKTIPTKDFPFPFFCRLVADSLGELQDFGLEKLGLRREWLKTQEIPHFCLGMTHRNKAIELGAKPLSAKKKYDLWRQYRELSKRVSY